MKKISKYLLIIFSALLFLSACSTDENNSASEDNDVEVVTSIFPVYEMTKGITGDELDVSLMVGANEDAHHYEPSAQAVASVNEADIFIYSSNEMEFWVESLLDVVENEDLQVIELADGLDLAIDEEDHNHTGEENHSHDHGHDHGGLDPHFWLDPVAVKEQLPLISEGLIEVNPENEEIYQENLEDFSNQLATLDQDYEAAFENATNRNFVVQHQAFGHLANRYNLEQIAVGGLTTEVEPAPQELAEIVDFVNEQEVPVIYYQSGENSSIAETIADGTDTDIAVLYDLESEPTNLAGENNAYLEAMYENLEQLEKSIQ